MKTKYLLEAFVLSGAILVAACQKEDMNALPDGAIRLTSEVFHGNGKTSVNGTSVQWDGNSTETVNVNGNDYEVLVNPSNQAYIDPGSPISGSKVYGYYPSDIIDASGWESSAPTVTIPNYYDCHYVGGRQVIALPMAAYSTFDGTPTKIEFKHLTAAVKVMVRNEINSNLTLRLDKVVVSSSDYLLSGRTAVTLGENSDPIVPAVEATNKNSVTAYFSDHPIIPYSTGSDDNRIEVQVPIRPIGDGSNTTPITVEVHAFEDGNAGRTFTFIKENVSVSSLSRNMMLTAGCRISDETGLVTEFNYLATPLTFEAKSAGTIVTFTPAAGVSLEYSTDGYTWTSYGSTPITLANIGNKVSFRGDNTTMATSSSVYSRFSCSDACYVYGNVMSLLDKNDFASASSLDADYTFCRLFHNNANIYNHPSKELALPATTLRKNCYQNMFSNCTNITLAPSLPAETLAEMCYSNMFLGCSKLTVAPKLPATTLSSKCYMNMFQGCTSLMSIPVLPATIVTYGCYQYMFQNCTGLISVASLPATSLAEYCYANMFQGCSNLINVPSILPATTISEECYSYMFEGCSSLKKAPELPALTLSSGCYTYMFKGCTHLNYVKCLATTIMASTTTNWLQNVTATGTFIKANTASWSVGNSGIPSGWTVENAN